MLPKELRDCSNQKNDSLEHSCGDYLIASIHDINGNYVEAIFNYKNALNRISVKNHAYLVATLNSKMAYSMNRIGKYDSALVYYDVSLAIREKIGYKLGVINT